jgi:hypothetical protein
MSETPAEELQASAVTVYGASDDLIELGGDIRAEFDAYREGEVVAFSNGTLLRVRYEDTGIWRITLLSGEAYIVPAPADDEDNYSDRATITGPVKWVAFGDQVAYAPRTPRATPVIAASSPLPDSETEPTAKDAGETLRLWHGSLHKAEESEYDHGYRVAYERIADWLEHEFPAIWAAGNAPQQQEVTS